MKGRMRHRVALVAVGMTLICGACNRGGSAATEEGVPPDMEAAREIFSQRCVTCHGETGQGDGPASAGLETDPRNFTDPTWQDEVSNEHIEQIIVQGGAAVGRSAAMPNNPDLRERPEVVAGLRQLIRGFGGE